MISEEWELYHGEEGSIFKRYIHWKLLLNILQIYGVLSSVGLQLHKGKYSISK